MQTTLIGRKEEQDILLKALKSPEAEMVAVYGRRRVGKTWRASIGSRFRNWQFEFGCQIGCALDVDRNTEVGKALVGVSNVVGCQIEITLMIDDTGQGELGPRDFKRRLHSGKRPQI